MSSNKNRELDKERNPAFLRRRNSPHIGIAKPTRISLCPGGKKPTQTKPPQTYNKRRKIKELLLDMKEHGMNGGWALSLDKFGITETQQLKPSPDLCVLYMLFSYSNQTVSAGAWINRRRERMRMCQWTNTDNYSIPPFSPFAKCGTTSIWSKPKPICAQG